MLPFFKLFSLFVRILARPIISKTKAATSSRVQDVKTRAFFIWIGNRAHKINVIINRKFLKLDNSDFKVQELNEPAALELGVETFYEMIIYACILGLPLIEIYRGHLESEEKSEKSKKVMEDIHTKLQKLQDDSIKQAGMIKHLHTVNDLLRSKSSLLENAFITEKLLKKQNPNLSNILVLQQEVEKEEKQFAELAKEI